MLKSRVGHLVNAARILATTQWRRAKYLMDTYVRGVYLYNLILLNNVKTLKKINKEVCRTIFKALLRSKGKVVRTSLVPLLRSLFSISSLPNKVRR